MNKTEDFQNRMNEHIGFMFNFVGVLIGFLALFLTNINFCEYAEDAIYLKSLYFLTLLFLAICLLFGVCVMAGPIFKDSIHFNFMGYNKPMYDKKVKKCLCIAYDFFGLGLFLVVSIVVFLVLGSLSWVIIFDVSVLLLFGALFRIYIKSAL